jgi:Ca2+-binding RTX toxin-like protein
MTAHEWIISFSRHLLRPVGLGVPLVLVMCLAHDEPTRELPDEEDPAATDDQTEDNDEAPIEVEQGNSFTGTKPPASAASCAGAECCPPKVETIVLSTAADFYVNEQDAVCIRSLGGDDIIHDEAVGGWILTGDGDDHITSTGARVVHAGNGDDKIEVEIDGGEIIGGPGDDWIVTGKGHYIITPGPGADIVEAGPGPVVVQILDACELEQGESLSASGEDDLLVLPIPLEAAIDIGVSIEGFERILVTGATCLSECAPADCVFGEVVP